MQNFLKRFSVVAAFAIVLVVLLAATLMTRRQLGIQLKNDYWVNHSRQVMLEVETTESLLKDAETGQRGFLYTGEARYLEPYDIARTQIDLHIDKVATLTADNAQQQSAVAELRTLSHEKLSELGETIALYRGGKSDEARALVLSDRGLVLMTRIRQVIDRMQSQEIGIESTRAAAYQRSVLVTIRSIYLACGIGVVGLILLASYILREMDRREQQAQEIRARELWFRITLTSIGDAVIATDGHGKVTFLNPVAERLTGTSMAGAMNKDILEVFPIFNEFTGLKTDNPVTKVVEQGQTVGLANHTVLRHPDGRVIPIEDSAAPIRDDAGNLIGVVLVFRDVTGERKSQDLLRKSEKLSAAARLSATVAHEINNPLEAVGNLIYIAKATPGAPPEVVEQLTAAEHELERVAHITRQTLGFYRESNEPAPLDIAPVLDSVVGLYSNKLRAKNITVQRDFSDGLPIIGVAGELRQAFSNLVSNALDAVEVNGQIRVMLRTFRSSEGNTVEVVVEDDGPGISGENLDRIFEPFFTTKKDVGTGLGLWVTKEIVERHDGTITIRAGRSADDLKGACFVVHFPADPDPHAHESLVQRI